MGKRFGDFQVNDLPGSQSEPAAMRAPGESYWELGLQDQHCGVMTDSQITQSGTKTHRILLVDDDPSMLTLLPRILVRKGFEVQVAGDADEAERVLEKDKFDAVVIDVQLPDRDGFSLAVAIHERWPALRIVFVTAFDSDATRKKAEDLGAGAFLTKPIGVDELIGHLRR
jgi:CheY-like chemotaxis protein